MRTYPSHSPSAPQLLSATEEFVRSINPVDWQVCGLSTETAKRMVDGDRMDGLHYTFMKFAEAVAGENIPGSNLVLMSQALEEKLPYDPENPVSKKDQVLRLAHILENQNRTKPLHLFGLAIS